MSKEIKRHFYNGQHYILDENNKTVELLPAFYTQLKTNKLWGRFGFKKIGGSSIGDVLEVDKYHTQFAAYCRMAWIGIPILDRKYVDAGIAIEPKVIKAIEDSSGKHVETYDPIKHNFDYFANKDNVVGGLPDGYIQEDNTVIEIKTTGEKNFNNWNTYGIPKGYHKQSLLYSYLMNADTYAIVATFLKEEDYANPYKYPIKDRKLKSWKFKVDRAQAEDDIKKVKSWYFKYTSQTQSPQYDEVVDADLIEWLRPSSEQEWNALKLKWTLEGKIPG